MTTKRSRPDNEKALPGSMEQALYDRRAKIEKALLDAAFEQLAGDMYVTDTFPPDDPDGNRCVVCVWKKVEAADGEYYSWEQYYYEIEITAESDDGFEFGAIKEVEKKYTESLVPAKASGAPRTKARMGFELKSLTPIDDDVGGWTFGGYFSVFDYEDHSKDIVRRGSMKESLAVHLPKILDHHGRTVGQSTKAYEDEHGLYVEGRIYNTRDGEDLVKLMRPVDTDLGPHAPVEQGSIGYSAMEGGAKRRQGGGWEYTKLYIWEVSPVTFGDNDATSVGLKSLGEVNAMPTEELMGYAADVARLALNGADGFKTLCQRRVVQNRKVGDDLWQAADELAVVFLDAGMELVQLKGMSDKAASAAQLRHTRAIIEGLTALIHGPADAPMPAPDPVDEDEDDTGAGAKARARGAGASAGGDEAKARPNGAASQSKDGREREAELIWAELALTEV